MNEGNLLGEISTVLRVLSDDWQHTRTVAGRVKITRPLSSVLLCAESLGFVKREIRDEIAPVGEAQWRITPTGKRFIRFAAEEPTSRTEGIEIAPTVQIVMTMPRRVREAFALRNVEVVRTQDTFYSLLRDAREEVLIFSPYIDAGFAQMADVIDKRTRVRLVTTIDRQAGIRPSASLARVVASHPDFELRYLFEQNEFGGQQTQIHAKLITSDRQVAYVGSANLTETSILHNLELGVLVSDHAMVKQLRTIFYDVFENFARKFV